MLQSINPYNQEVIQNYKEHSIINIENIINEADTAFKKWQ